MNDKIHDLKSGTAQVNSEIDALKSDLESVEMVNVEYREVLQ